MANYKHRINIGIANYKHRINIDIANYKHRINIDIAKCMITKHVKNGKKKHYTRLEVQQSVTYRLGKRRRGKKTTDLTICKAVKLLKSDFFSPTYT